MTAPMTRRHMPFLVAAIVGAISFLISSAAGWEAAAILEEQNKWTPALRLYQRLNEMIPELRTALDKKILNAKEKAALQKD